jgi:hypothetical protein
MISVTSVESVLRERGVVGHVGQDYTLRDDGDGPYIEHWESDLLGPRPTEQELAAVVPEPEPRLMRTRDILRNMTPSEHLAFATLALQDPLVCHAHHVLLAGEQVNIRSREFQEGWQYVIQVAVPSIWPTIDIAKQRTTQIIGESLV